MNEYRITVYRLGTGEIDHEEIIKAEDDNAAGRRAGEVWNERYSHTADRFRLKLFRMGSRSPITTIG